MISKKQYLIVFLLGLLIGFLSFAYYGMLPVEGDALGQFKLAKLLKEDISVLWQSSELGLLEPLNFILNGFLFLLPGSDKIMVFVFNIFVYALTGLFVYRLGLLFLKDKFGAFLFFLFFLFNHKYWFFILNFKPDIRVVFLLVVIFYLTLLVCSRKHTMKIWIFLGLASSLLVLLDMRYLPHLGLIFLFLLYKLWPLKYYWRYFAVAGFFFLVLITPWMIRQYKVFDKPVLISEFKTWMIHKAFNTNKYQHLDLLYQDLGEPNPQQIDSLIKEQELETAEGIFLKVRVKEDSPEKMHDGFSKRKEALIKKGFSKEQIESKVKRGERRSGFFNFLEAGYFMWKPWQTQLNYIRYQPNKMVPPWSMPTNINRLFSIGLLIPFFVLGFFNILKKKNHFGILLVGILVLHTIIHVLTYVQPRYVLPVLPFYTLIAIKSITAFYPFIKEIVISRITQIKKFFLIDFFK